ncbi:hypothetical protein [Actinomadura sp. CNU-125]|uniref:hypothetical protein n=1 Tax=Actinomadura sp. CNU-125 TaxID=1904961 RepID=UPI0039674F02
MAIARALVTRPAVIFGDEPTGALDTGNARGVLALLREVVADAGRTVVMVTHDRWRPRTPTGWCSCRTAGSRAR